MGMPAKGDWFDDFGHEWEIVKINVGEGKRYVDAKRYSRDAFGKREVIQNRRFHIRDLESMRKISGPSDRYDRR